MLLYFSYIAISFIVIVYVNYWTCKAIDIKQEVYKYNSLTGLRGICAAFVVISHTFWRWEDESNYSWNLNVFKSDNILMSVGQLMGPLSVSFFFILSGFLFLKFSRNPNKSIIVFLKERFLRLYPSIFFSILLIFFALLLTIGMKFIYSCSLDILQIIPTIFGPFDNTYICQYKIANINSGVLWSLVWEVRLYLFIVVLCIIFKYIKNDLFIVLFLFSLTIFLYIFNILNNNDTSYVLLFIAGFFAASLEKKINIPIILLWFSLLSFPLLYHIIKEPYYSPFYVIIVFMIFYPIMKGYNPLNIFGNEKIQYLGITSFSLYLNHGVFQFLSKYYLYSYGNVLWQFVSMIIVSIVSPFLYKYIEKKFYK